MFITILATIYFNFPVLIDINVPLGTGSSFRYTVYKNNTNFKVPSEQEYDKKLFKRIGQLCPPF